MKDDDIDFTDMNDDVDDGIEFEFYSDLGKQRKKTRSDLKELQSSETASKFKKEIYDWVQCAVVALLCCMIAFVFVAQSIGVIGTSMLPTLHDGDKVIASNLFYTPSAGDIIILTKSSFSDEPIVKRVIATEGQTVDIDFDKGEVRVDGVPLEEDYIAELTRRALDFKGPVTVPEGCVFVMGDNRNGSTDSRDSRIGMVDTRCILGKVYAIISPLGRLGLVSHA